MRFLIDECLSIDLVSVASQAGHEAQHVARVGKAGWKDWNVARHSTEGDFVLVTNNASDFRRLYATQPLQAGLAIIIPSVDRVMQQQLFRGALDELTRFGEPVNRVLEVDIEDDDVTFKLYDLPRASPHQVGRNDYACRHQPITPLLCCQRQRCVHSPKCHPTATSLLPAVFARPPGPITIGIDK
jgi:predicted nuclease of predicted toxin-antitoxin system